MKRASEVKVLSFKLKKQTSKNLADTTFKTLYEDLASSVIV